MRPPIQLALAEARSMLPTGTQATSPPKPPHTLTLSPHFLSFCLLFGQILPVEVVTFIFVALNCQALLLNFKCLSMSKQILPNV